MICPHCQGTGKVISDDLHRREMDFRHEVGAMVLLLNSNEAIYKEFIDYWSEANRSKTKMRFEMQTTWDLKKRIQRFIRNEKKFNHKKEYNKEKVKMPSGYGNPNSLHWQTRKSNSEPKKLSELIKK